MFIVMHCGGITFNGDTIKTKSLGGSESAAYYVARELVELGHNVTMFTNSEDTGVFEGVKYEWAGGPSEAAPLGDRFTFYAENTPHDVLIIQRHPLAFARKYASKINLWWLHDLALYRNKDLVMGHMWNVDKVLCVSEYHKKQVSSVWGIPETHISVVKNGVDLSLYADDSKVPMLDVKVTNSWADFGHVVKDGIPRFNFPDNEYHMFYSSRPERGLINLVKVDGIMEKLKDLPVHLHVCGYDNTTPATEELYSALWNRCDVLENVTNHGALTKLELAALQKECDCWIYPTEFEEVSCITVMEAMAADCDILASAVAAIPETCSGSHAMLIDLKNGASDIDQFVDHIAKLNDGTLCNDSNLPTATQLTWKAVAERTLRTVEGIFSTALTISQAHHFMRHSDIPMFESLLDSISCLDMPLARELANEYDEGYHFYRNGTFAEHYAAYYQYEKDRGVNYGKEDVSRTSRFQAVANYVGQLPAGSRVLDYGCAHGHYAINLARRFPNISFVGADLAQSNIDTARKWAESDGLKNISFMKVAGVYNGRVCDKDAIGVLGDMMLDRTPFDLIIAAEVIEHVANPQHYIDILTTYLTATGKMVITVPYGPWEAQGYREHKYWRAHLHHFERLDLFEMLGHHPDYKIVAAPSGMSKFYSVLGSYILSFSKPKELSRPINYARKLLTTMPDQTVSCCMIVKNAETDILRCLRSVLPHVQELIVGIDGTTDDVTRDLIKREMVDNPLVGFKMFDIPPASETGFAAARNAVIKEASCDWVLWIDSDEVLMGGELMNRYTRNSMYNGLAVKQHHFSHSPVCIMKVDLPCRLFRNYIGVQFFGLVHEHPEKEINKGLGPVSLASGVEIVHNGYVDEGVRRKRFSRNLPLLKRDREENPQRILGKFLWLRDLAQSCQYDIEDGSALPDVIDARIAEGTEVWKDLLTDKNYRIVLDALPFYSQLMMMRGNGVDFSFKVASSYTEQSSLEKEPVVQGYFASKEDALELMNALAIDRIGELDRRYL